LDRLFSTLARFREEMTAFTQRLVAIPTENPPGANYERCVAEIAAELERLGLQPRVHDESVLSDFGGGERVLYFHGHYDVVPASAAGQFEPVLKNGNLFGRGSSDMKSGIAAMVYAVKALQAADVPLAGRVGLVIVPDEETGGKRGSERLAAAGLLGRDAIGMLTAEPTGGVVWNACRGAISLRVRVKGKPAHVGLQHQGRNAFEGMLAAASALRELKSRVEARTAAYAIHPEAARRSILMLGGECGGGTNFNLVPDACWFTIDRRINPEEDLETEKRELLNVLERVRAGGVDLEVEVLQCAPAAGTSGHGELAQALSVSVDEVCGAPPRFEMCPGLLEIRYYAHRGAPAFAYGPGLLSVSHGPHEFVPVNNIYTCAQVYAATAARLLA
jgi:acetylornithine deacetylase/succinyl-diaminopimelate desuccinylase family protein